MPQDASKPLFKNASFHAVAYQLGAIIFAAFFPGFVSAGKIP